MTHGSRSRSEDENTWIPEGLPASLDPPPKPQTDSGRICAELKRGKTRGAQAKK